jgi:hypothetical protein
VRRCIFSALIATCLSGCAHVPNTSIYYYPSQTTINVQVTRLIGCSTDNQLFSSQTVKAEAINVADKAHPIELDLGLLNSTFANTSFSADFFDDGRLKGINVAETGKAGEIVKSAASLVKMILPVMATRQGTLQYFPKLCGIIAAEKDKIVSLKYEEAFDPAIQTDAGYQWDIPLASESQYFRAQAEATAGAELAAIDFKIARDKIVQPNVGTQGKGNAGISIKYPARTTFILSAGEMQLWKNSLSVAQLGSDGWLPIARAPAFGKTTTVIDLNDDGSIKKVVYGSETGTKDAIDAVSDGVGLAKGQTDSERAAAADAEARRIKAERALLKCRTEPASC